MKPGEGLVTDMRAVRKDYFLDHDHTAYVDQWDWERAITAEQRTLDDPHRDGARDLAGDPLGRGARARHVPAAARPPLSEPPRRARRSSTPRTCSPCTPTCRASSGRRRSCRSTRRCSSTGSAGRSPTGTRTRCAPRTTTTGSRETVSADGRPMHGLNGDILVWNPVTQRRHELSSMGVRVTKETLVAAARADRPARLPGAAVPPGDPRGPDPALDRRRHRPVAGDDAAAPQGPPRRGERDRVARRAEGDVRRTEHPRARVRSPPPATQARAADRVPGRGVHSRRTRGRLREGRMSMGWRRDEVWFDTDVALVPRAAAEALRSARARGAGVCHRPAPSASHDSDRDGARGLTTATAPGAGGAEAPARHAHGAGGRARPRVGHDAADRRAPALERRAGRTARSRRIPRA